ncbi:MAG: serine hydrolase, partial [Spirochaetales bacterium]|nr:serine hydrolase [Spirochaetales bacterium]
MKIFHSIYYILIGFLLLDSAVSCKVIVQPEENPLTKEINDALDYPVFRKQLSGIISVSVGKEEVFNKVYYLSNDIPEEYREVKMDDNTQFMIGSLTKQFTAMAILILQQQGKISLEDNINQYIPNFPWGNVINIHDILTHTAGLPRDPFHEYMIHEFDADFPDTYIRNIVTDPLRQRTIMNEYTFNEKQNRYLLKKNVSDNKKGEL